MFRSLQKKSVSSAYRLYVTNLEHGSSIACLLPTESKQFSHTLEVLHIDEMIYPATLYSEFCSRIFSSWVASFVKGTIQLGSDGVIFSIFGLFSVS